MKEGLEFEAPIVELEKRIKELQSFTEEKNIDCTEELKLLGDKLERVTKDVFSNLSPWQRVQVSRHPKRPYTRDYIDMIVEDFYELHGDRRFGDDPAMVTGFGKIAGRTVAVVGHQKGRDIKEKMACHFGCAHPEGYRKANRIMHLAEKKRIPVVCLIDTPGAYPGIGAEERGQSEAIAFNIMEMTDLKTPTIGIVIGEGGSGGALGIGMTDVLAIMENSYYSVISPEGCSAILWKDKGKLEDAAEALKIMPKDLLKMKIVDEIIEEPLGGAHRHPRKTAENIQTSILKYIQVFDNILPEDMLKRRYEKYRHMGQFQES